MSKRPASARAAISILGTVSLLFGLWTIASAIPNPPSGNTTGLTGPSVQQIDFGELGNLCLQVAGVSCQFAPFVLITDEFQSFGATFNGAVFDDGTLFPITGPFVAPYVVAQIMAITFENPVTDAMFLMASAGGLQYRLTSLSNGLPVETMIIGPFLGSSGFIGFTASSPFDTILIETLNAVGPNDGFGLDTLQFVEDAPPPPPPAPVRGIITSPNEFSGLESVVDFEGLSVGSQLSNQLQASFGIVFSMDPATGPAVGTDTDPRMFGPAGDISLNNVPLPCDPSGFCGFITIDFDSPVNRVGFEIRGLDPGDVDLMLICLNGGEVVGTADYTGGPDYRMFGVESDQVFDRVDIVVMSPVSIDNLRFELDLTDSDLDGVIDPGDNCPDAPNAGQEDADGDGFGDDCFGPVVHDNGVDFLGDFDGTFESFQSTVNPGTFPVPEEPRATYILADDFVLSATQNVGGARWIGTNEDRAAGTLLPRVGETQNFRILFFDHDPTANEPDAAPISEAGAFAIRDVSVTGGRGHPRHSAYAPLYSATFSSPVLLSGGVRYWIAMVAVDDFTTRSGVDGAAYGHWVSSTSPDGNAKQGSTEFASPAWMDRGAHMAFSLLGGGPVAPPANLPPSCDSGGPFPDLVCQDGPMQLALDGTGSNDPEGSPLSYDWTVSSCEGASFDDSTSATPLLTVQPPPGPSSCGVTQCDIDLTVSDGANQTQCLTEDTAIKPKLSVEDLTFVNALTSVQVPPNTQQQVQVEFQNDGTCPSEVESIEVLPAVGPSPVVTVVSPTLGSPVCPATTVTVTLDVDTTGLPETSYDRIISLNGQDSSISANVRIIVGALKPDLTPISMSASSIVITGDTGPPPLDVGENATIAVTISNVGAAAASAYDVNFFANGNLLGTVNAAAGLAAGNSALAQLVVPGGALVAGTHVIRIEVASPPGSESDLSNNAANSFLQVGAPTAGSDAIIQVSAGATDACEDGTFRVSGHAQYILTSTDASGSPVLLNHVVQGGIVSVEVFAVGGSEPVRLSFTQHTNTNGDFSVTLDAPAAGSYFAVVEVTDLTLIGDDQASLTILSVAECTPPPPPPPPQVFTLGLNVCEKDAGGGPIDFGDPIFTVDGQACVDPELNARDLTIRASGNFAPAQINLESALWTENGAGGFAPETYETLDLTLNVVPDELPLSGNDCVTPPDADGVIRLDVTDVNKLDPSSHPVTQARSGSVSTGNLDLAVENLHTEGACFSNLSTLGSVRYVTGPGSFADGLPVSCGTVRASLLDPTTGFVRATSGVGTTSATGRFGVGIGFFLARDVTWPVEVEISDGVITRTFETTARCAATQGSPSGGGRPAPPVVSPTGVQSQDMFLFAEDVVFLGNGTCSAGLVGTPEPGDELGIAATIHLEGGDSPIIGQTITVREHVPVNGQLVPTVVATPTVDFPAGVKEAQICVPWTPQTNGYRVIQVEIEPDQIVQYQLNDAATRAIRVGTNPCLIELSERFLTMNRGGSSALSVRGDHQEGVTPVLDLSLLPMPSESLPPGLTAIFGSPTLVGNSSESLTVETTTATPPGRFSFAVVADGTICTAIASLTVVVNGLGPDLEPITDQSLQCGQISLPLVATDPEGDALDLTASGLPSFASLVDNGDGTGTLQIDAAGSDRGVHTGVTVTASDAFDFFDSETFQIEITDQAPQLTPVEDSTLTCLGGSIPVSASDDDNDPLGLSLNGSTPLISLLDNQDGTGSIVVGTGIASGDYALEVVATDQTCGGTASEGLTLSILANALPVNTAITPQEIRARDTLGLTLSSVDPEGGAVTLVGQSLPSFAGLNGSDLTLTPGDADVGAYTIEVLALDACGGSSVLSFELTVLPANTPPAAEAGGPYSVDEGDSVSLDGTGSTDPDQDPSTLTYEWDLDYDGVSFEVDATGASPLFDAAGLDGPSDSRTVALRVTDSAAESTIDSASVGIDNVDPVLGPIVAPLDPIALDTPVETSVGFTDAGVGDTHTAEWSWGDNTVSAGSVSSGTVTGEHTYSEAGVYAIEVTLTDDDGGTAMARFEFVVIYDPDGGFVTGGGWIDSPEGAYPADPSLTGRANFGFVSKYKKGASIPTGVTEFQFKAGDLNFHSDTYQWLVVAGAKAMFKGVGTINGSGAYDFMLSATDGKLKNNDPPDTFRMRVWEVVEDPETLEEVDSTIYDNQLGTAEDAEPLTSLGGGQIVIHKQ